MNPEENNNLPNGPARPDVNAENLAAALDNLTAAGRAMGDGMSMPNLTDNPTAEMAMPPAEDAPLVPAAPVPGSIGSVMSVPANDINQGAPMDGGSPLMADTPTPNAGMNTSMPGAQPAPNPGPMSPLEMVSQAAAPQGPVNPFAPRPAESATVPGAGMPPVAPGNPAMPPKDNMGMPANSPNPAPSPNGFTPYNPFAPNNSNPTMPPVQPDVNNKPNAKTKPAKSGTSFALPWILMALFLLTTIIFGVLYVMEMTKEPQVIYKPMPTENEEDSSATVSIMSCNRSLEGVVLDSGITAISGFQDVTLNFKDDVLSKISIKTESSFTADTPEGTEPTGEIQTANSELSMESNELNATTAPAFLLTTNEAGEVDLSKEALRVNYTNQGFFCQDE